MSGASLHLCRRWTEAPPAVLAPAGAVLRPVAKADTAALGSVMYEAFLGSADDGFDTPGEAVAEVAGTLAGRWGALVTPASVVALAGGALVGGALVVRDETHGGTPLLAFIAVAPAQQGRGLGRVLVIAALGQLHDLGVRELHLAVAPANPARRLYERLGFELVAPAGPLSAEGPHM